MALLLLLYSCQILALTSFLSTCVKANGSILTHRMHHSTRQASVLLCKRKSREVPALLVHRRLAAALEARAEAGFTLQRHVLASTGLERSAGSKITVSQAGDVFVALARN